MSEGASGVSIDEDFRIRVLDPNKHKASQLIRDKTEEFTSKLSTLQKIVKKYIDAVDVQAQRIEAEKLKAVGMRNHMATVEDERDRMTREANAQLREKQTELDRLQAEEAALIRVRQEQEAMIQKLSDN